MDYLNSINSDASLVLSHLSTDYLLSIIDNAINNNNISIGLKAPNLIQVLEKQYSIYLSTNTLSEEEREKILTDRANIYSTVLNKLCNVYGLSLSVDIQTIPVMELYTITNILYGLLVSEYSTNITNFFVSYIYLNTNAIYDSIDKSKMKTQQNTGAYFAKVTHDDNKIATIATNLESVLYNIGGMDIGFDVVLTTLFGPLGVQLSDIVSSDTFFKDVYVKEINRPEYISEIILALHRR